MGYQVILCPISDRIITKGFYYISQSSVDTSAYYRIGKKIQFSSVWPGRNSWKGDGDEIPFIFVFA